MAATIQAILEGAPGSAVREKMGWLEARKEELTDQLARAEGPPPLLHPSLAQVYRERIASLSEALGWPGTRTEAAEAMRSLVSGIELTPDDGKLTALLEVFEEAAGGCGRLVGAGTRNQRFLRLAEFRQRAA